MLSICLVISLLLSGLFLGMTLRTRSLIMDELLTAARSKFEIIVAMRAWNARYGGVYVEKARGVESNPFIANADIELRDGRLFTLRNPAMMTREVAEVLGDDKDVTFHITSEKLMNPGNKPDAFERAALKRFYGGEREVYSVGERKGQMFFQYMGPLYITKPCLQCHANMGYREGEVRGGISITFNIDDAYRKMRLNSLLIFVFSASTLIAFILIFWLLTVRLVTRLDRAQRKIEELSTVDDLTRIFNRKYINAQLEREFLRARRLGKPLSCLLLDLDNFKAVNDTHGHATGDRVLVEVCARINSVIRAYDSLGRFGGEEFIVVLPETTLEEGVSLAERIRTEVRDGRTADNLAVTVSIGVASLEAGDTTFEMLLKRADTMLYAAKDAGKDCVKP